MNGNLFCKKMYANFNTSECHEIEIKSKDNRPPDSISRFLQAGFHRFIFPFSSSQLAISAISSCNITHFTAQYG